MKRLQLFFQKNFALINASLFGKFAGVKVGPIVNVKNENLAPKSLIWQNFLLFGTALIVLSFIIVAAIFIFSKKKRLQTSIWAHIVILVLTMLLILPTLLSIFRIFFPNNNHIWGQNLHETKNGANLYKIIDQSFKPLYSRLALRVIEIFFYLMIVVLTLIVIARIIKQKKQKIKSNDKNKILTKN